MLFSPPPLPPQLLACCFWGFALSQSSVQSGRSTAMQANHSLVALPKLLPSFFFLKTSFPVPIMRQAGAPEVQSKTVYLQLGFFATD